MLYFYKIRITFDNNNISKNIKKSSISITSNKFKNFI